MSATPTYHFYLKDHLGNNRMVVNNRGVVAQQTDYYPFGYTFNKSGSSDNKYLYNGKEMQVDGIGISNLDWLDYGWRFYDPILGRFHTVDPLTEKNHSQSGFVYAANNPIKYIDYMGLDTTIYFFDQPAQPIDDYKTASYTAKVYVDIDGTINGPYDGSTYPDSKKDENTTEHNTLNEGNHDFNNVHGHQGGGKKGLNIVKDKNKSTQTNRVAEGTDPNGNPVNPSMTVVNIHTGYNTRRFSEGCPTIAPYHWDSFSSNFDWSGGNTGTSKGIVTIYRTNTLEKTVMKKYLQVKQLLQKMFNQ